MAGQRWVSALSPTGFGRRAIFTVSLVWYSLATLVMAFQHSAAAIDLWRFIAAIGVGLEQVTIDTLLPELVPADSRGRAFAFNQFIEFSVVPVGGAAGLAAGAAASFWHRWLALCRPDRLSGRAVRLVAAAAACRKARAGWRCMAAASRRKKSWRNWKPMWRVISAMLCRRRAPHDGLVPEQGRFAEIFAPPYGGRTLMLSVFNAMQTIAFYGFGSWVPTLLIAKGIHVTTSLEYAFIIALANPVGPLLGLLVADRMERKWQIGERRACAWRSSCCCSRCRKDMLLVILFGVLVTLANNWISFATHNYQSELYPTRVRARAVGFVYSWSRLSAALAGLLIGFFLRQAGTLGVALFIGGAMTVMVITIAGFGPRTRGRSLEEISR